MDYVLTTNALCKKYGAFKALNSVSMHIPKGAIYGFIGKNGLIYKLKIMYTTSLM